MIDKLQADAAKEKLASMGDLPRTPPPDRDGQRTSSRRSAEGPDIQAPRWGREANKAGNIHRPPISAGLN